LSKTTAYLGPQGSYSELALRHFLKDAQGVPCLSIAEVFSQLSKGLVEQAFVPIENIIEGPVTETLDQLFENRNKLYIQNSFNYLIQHCLGAINEKHEEITHIYSKDQALRQCSKFINEKFTNSRLCTSNSTGAAVEMIASNKLKNCAAVAAEQTIKSFGLKVIAENISDIPNNQTRFILLGTEKKSPKSNSVTTVLVNPGRDRQGLLFEILEVISVKHKSNLKSIHSRPDSKGGFIFHLDLEGSEDSLTNCIEELRNYCSSITATIDILGSYQQTPFNSKIASPIGILGGAGKMGLWFKKFFNSIGVEVLINDPNSDDSIKLKKLCESCKIIILSVPINSAESVIKELLKHVKAGSLIVENFSIKHACLNKLIEQTSKDVEVLGIHTMFGSDVETLRKQNIIISKNSKSKELSNNFIDLLHKHGANISELDASEHDNHAAYLQSLIQFLLLGYGKSLSEAFDSKKDIESMNTPNSKNFVSTLKRVLNLSNDLLADMQIINPENKKARENLIKNLKNIDSLIDNEERNKIVDLKKEIKSFID